jgi:hypothetical protein
MSVKTEADKCGEYVHVFTCASVVFMAQCQNEMPNDQIGPMDTIWSAKSPVASNKSDPKLGGRCLDRGPLVSVSSCAIACYQLQGCFPAMHRAGRS